VLPPPTAPHAIPYTGPFQGSKESSRNGHTRAAAGSLVTWRTCRTAGWEHDRGMQLPTGPQIWDIHRPRLEDRPTSRVVGTSDVCSNAAVNSDLSCFLYRGRLRWLYLNCQADHHHHHHHQVRVASKGRRVVAPPCPRSTARLQRSPIGRVELFCSWSSHLFHGRPGGRRHVRSGGRLSDTLMWS